MTGTPALLVDSHCHLDMLDLSAEEAGLGGVLEAARDAGVGHMLCVSVNLEDYPAMCGLTAPYENVSVSVGVHPNERQGKDPDADELAVAGDDRGFDGMGQLADVAGPGVGSQPLDRAGREAAEVAPVAAREPLQEGVGEEGDVSTPGAQGWQVERQHAQAVEQVATEPAPCHGLVQPGAGRGHDAGIDADAALGAEAPHLPVLERGEQLGLQGGA